MMANLKYWLKGLAVAALSMVVYAGALGCYIALMLLVISMEEGGDNLSAFSVSLTEAVVLLSQGSGFKTGSITLTIMPLLLTVLRSLLSHRSPNASARVCPDAWQEP